MPTKYVSDKTTILYENPTGGSRKMILIYGDEVETSGRETPNGRIKATFRQKDGWIRAGELGDTHPLEIYFIDVGQGDSTFIVTPAGKKILIDGGTGDEALQFLIWKYRLKDDPARTIDIDMLVLTHADGDHILGLTRAIRHPKIHVQRIVHSGIARFASGAFNTRLGQQITVASRKYLVTSHDSIADLAGLVLDDDFQDWRNAIATEQASHPVSYHRVDSATGSLDVGDPSVEIEVLGPHLVNHPTAGGQVYPWLGNDAHTINGHSVVLLLKYDGVRVLFPGDLNEEGEEHLMQNAAIAAKLDAHVLKAPHHGSHEFDLSFMRAIHPQISVISSGETPDHGHPRANLLGTLGKVSRSDEPLIFSTELSAIFTRAQDDPEPEIPDITDPNLVTDIHARFKKYINGLTNIRTDGSKLYAFRRVAAGYWWVSYEIAPASRDPRFSAVGGLCPDGPGHERLSAKT